LKFLSYIWRRQCGKKSRYFLYHINKIRV